MDKASNRSPGPPVSEIRADRRRRVRGEPIRRLRVSRRVGGTTEQREDERVAPQARRLHRLVKTTECLRDVAHDRCRFKLTLPIFAAAHEASWPTRPGDQHRNRVRRGDAVLDAAQRSAEK